MRVAAILADYVASSTVFPGLLVPMIKAEGQYDERLPLQYGRHERRQSWSYSIGGRIRRCQDDVYHDGDDGFLVYIPSVRTSSTTRSAAASRT